jgi:hypothetical protein
LVIRANPLYNINEDCWCLYYPDDFKSDEDAFSVTFQQVLARLLPQTRVLQKIMNFNKSTELDFSSSGMCRFFAKFFFFKVFLYVLQMVAC